MITNFLVSMALIYMRCVWKWWNFYNLIKNLWGILHFPYERGSLFTLYFFFLVCCCCYYCCRYCYFESLSSSSTVVVVASAIESWKHRFRITWSHSYSHWHSHEQTDLNHMHDKPALHPRIISLLLKSNSNTTWVTDTNIT